jgi:hypothetical protein|nr:hypothetical protein [Deltaproteobacteria bacterium]
MENSIEKNIKAILNTVVRVISNPVGFFHDMPKTGGFVKPLIFMMAIAAIAGIIRAILAVAGPGFSISFSQAIASIIIAPIFAGIFGFAGAGILFIIWKIMGSRQSFETAYRCCAYAGGIVPVTTVLGVIPFLGPILNLVWMTYLLVVASVEVHKLNQKISWIVFGTICAVFILIIISSQLAARQITS